MTVGETRGRLSVDPIPVKWSEKTNKARLCEATLNGDLHWTAEYEKYNVDSECI